VKAAVFSSAETGVLWKCSVPTPEKRDCQIPQSFEIEGEALYQQVRALLEEAAGRFPVEALLLSTQMHGFVYQLPGREDRYVSWQDARCTEKMPEQELSYLEYLKSVIPPEWMEACGVPLKPSLGMCNLYALLHGACDRAEEGQDAAEYDATGRHMAGHDASEAGETVTADGTLYTLGSYLNVRLGGENICHASNAAPLGLMDQQSRQWSGALLEKLGFEGISFPRIAEEDFISCGNAVVNGRSIRLYPVYGDQQVSVLGAMPEEGDLLINIATASQISCLRKQFMPGDYESRPYFGQKYLNTISNMPGGRNFGVLTDFLKECAALLCSRELSTSQIWQIVNDSVLQAADGGPTVDVLFFPTEHKTDGGSIRGIRPGNLTVGSLFAGAYADAAGIYREAMKRLEPEKGQEKGWRAITFLGGVSFKNPVLIGYIAKVLGLPYKKPKFPEEALNGLYRLSLAACGAISGLDEAREKHLEMREEA
jgi:hypothetical protein